jgi:hypothetical protein
MGSKVDLDTSKVKYLAPDGNRWIINKRYKLSSQSPELTQEMFCT